MSKGITKTDVIKVLQVWLKPKQKYVLSREMCKNEKLDRIHIDKFKNDKAVSNIVGMLLMLSLTVAIVIPTFVIGANALGEYVLEQAEIFTNRFFLELNIMVDSLNDNRTTNNDGSTDSYAGKPTKPYFEPENETLSFKTGNETLIISLRALNNMAINTTGYPVYRIPPPEP